MIAGRTETPRWTTPGPQNEMAEHRAVCVSPEPTQLNASDNNSSRKKDEFVVPRVNSQD